MYSLARMLWHLIGMGQEMHPCRLVAVHYHRTDEGLASCDRLDCPEAGDPRALRAREAA